MLQIPSSVMARFETCLEIKLFGFLRFALATLTNCQECQLEVFPEMVDLSTCLELL